MGTKQHIESNLIRKEGLGLRKGGENEQINLIGQAIGTTQRKHDM
jgi:hypothetical protein